MSKLRVLYVLQTYPQISQTYIESELDALSEECEIAIVGVLAPDLSYERHRPYRHLTDPDRIAEVIDEFRPDVLHTHYLIFAEFVGALARRKQIPFTVRTHSFDTLWYRRRLSWKGSVRRALLGARIPEYAQRSIPFVNDDLCLGILAFPFLRPHLERTGFRADKIHDCYPVVNFPRFHDPSPNGSAVMNVGACLPKKKMEDFLHLAQRVPGRSFNLYALGYLSDEISRLNQELGRPANLISPVEPCDMPREYKKHAWLVYTASRDLGEVGWPLSVAEAQASGLGVCIPNLRPDLKEYVGKAGFVYDSIDEVADIISRPFPEEMRQLGFEQARKSDIFRHKDILRDLWQKARTPVPSLSVA